MRIIKITLLFFNLLVTPIFAQNENDNVILETYDEGSVYVLSIEYQSGKPKALSFEFNYESEDGLSFVAIVKGRSDTELMPKENSDHCYLAGLTESFENSSSNYIICDFASYLAILNISPDSPPIMPRHIEFKKHE